ncbi:GTP pyrophosphokinase family protein [Planococcus sp. CPCC 101016]|uniref:GTP pyrophosphokinase n=1 Tax=Planococcus sp. CPCC 101016 TaxID=2599617 RepID=UPI0011B3B1DC|nr:GTP pyrophosphokinase family protein [Planococcus sp. CPCC 101016]TWT06408.1 GTP pyrophosphokinase family protein [Planococcus sp. CPCC 101016]
MDASLTKDLRQMKGFKKEMMRFMMGYKFALDEINTKITILQQEFQYIHDYNPIENVSSRVKSPESIMKKAAKKEIDLSLSAIKADIKDIAGIRITCSFETDIYQISDMLQNQDDLKVIEVKDYIKNPKSNGYRSLHLLLVVPIFMSDRVEEICVEVQIRTIAMDFWASLEHKIYYKYNKEVPPDIIRELKEAADSATQLDRKMEKIQLRMNKLKDQVGADEDFSEILIDKERFRLPNTFILNGPDGTGR